MQSCAGLWPSTKACLCSPQHCRCERAMWMSTRCVCTCTSPTLAGTQPTGCAYIPPAPAAAAAQCRLTQTGCACMQQLHGCRLPGARGRGNAAAAHGGAQMGPVAGPGPVRSGLPLSLFSLFLPFSLSFSFSFLFLSFFLFSLLSSFSLFPSFLGQGSGFVHGAAWEFRLPSH